MFRKKMFDLTVVLEDGTSRGFMIESRAYRLAKRRAVKQMGNVDLKDALVLLTSPDPVKS